MKHYLITGGTGMVGHHLVDRILQRESAQITILTRVAIKSVKIIILPMLTGPKTGGSKKLVILMLL